MPHDINKLPEAVFEGQFEKLQESRLILYLLDGYDEIQAHAGHGIFRELWSQDFWVVTSRPHFVEGWLLQEHKTIENIGFLEADIDRFIDRYFASIKNPEKAAVFKESIQKNLNLHVMSNVPINLEWLCVMAGEDVCIVCC